MLTRKISRTLRYFRVVLKVYRLKLWKATLGRYWRTILLIYLRISSYDHVFSGAYLSMISIVGVQ